MGVDRLEAIRRLVEARGATVGERTLADVLAALDTPSAVAENWVAEVRATSPTGDPAQVVISAHDVREAIRR